MIKTSLRALRLILLLVSFALVVFATIVLGAAWAKRSGPELQAWHRLTLDTEFSAAHSTRDVSFQEYLQTENRVFEELQRELLAKTPSAGIHELNRFSADSISFPVKGGVNLNRSTEFPLHPNRGSVLLLHGMTDGPYSMRHLAEIFRAQGFHVVNMRLPAHGTAPSELARIRWEDWMAAVRIGAGHARAQASPGQPFWILGYSNGAALGLKYTLDQLEQALPVPDRLVLVSPMIGVHRLAWVTRFFQLLGKIPWFEKSLWLDVFPEYDPHKYNSFPMNAARQSHELTVAINAQLEQLASLGRLESMPPVLTFQSLVDSSVATRAVGRDLYGRLPANGSELVLFDINRVGAISSLVRPEINLLMRDLLNPDRDEYAITVISNQSKETLTVSEFHKPARSRDVRERALDLAWPVNFFSLSHVALPFPPDDMIYGYLDPSAPSLYPRIGLAQGLGENGALAVPASLFTRARANPFFDYMAQRLTATIQSR